MTTQKPQLSPYQANTLQKLAKVLKGGNVGIFEYLVEIEKRLDEELPALKNIIEKIKGAPGDTPSEEYLISLIGSLIPEVSDGHTHTDQELLSLIQPLIPKVKNGETPSDSKLLSLIQPLIPKSIDTDLLAIEASQLAVNEISPLIPTIEDLEKDIPKLGVEIRDSLELLGKGYRLDAQYIDGLEEFIRELIKKYAPSSPSRIMVGGSKTTTSTGGGYTVETPVGAVDSLNMTYTVGAEPVYIVVDDVTRLVAGGAYTYSAGTITMTYPPENYIRSFHL